MKQKSSDSLICFLVYICCIIIIPFTLVTGIIFTVIFIPVTYILISNDTPSKPKIKKLTEEQKLLMMSEKSEKYDTIYFLLEFYETWELANWCTSAYNWDIEDALDIVEAINIEKKLNDQPKIQKK